MQDATTDGATEAPGPPAPQECGWFGSSHELREGLEVMELGVGLLLAAVCFAPDAEPGGSAG